MRTLTFPGIALYDSLIMTSFIDLFQLAAACDTNPGGLPSLWDGLCKSGTEVEFTSVADAGKLILNAVRILMTLSGALAVIGVFVAAIYYILSAGDPGRIKKAKDILVNLVIGLVLLIAAYAIVTFISNGFGN